MAYTRERHFPTNSDKSKYARTNRDHIMIAPNDRLCRTQSPPNLTDYSSDTSSEYTANGMLTPTSSYCNSPPRLRRPPKPHSRSSSSSSVVPNRVSKKPTTDDDTSQASTPTGRRSPTNNCLLAFGKQISAGAKRKRARATEEDGSQNWDNVLAQYMGRKEGKNEGPNAQQKSDPISVARQTESTKDIISEEENLAVPIEVDQTRTQNPFQCPVCFRRFTTDKEAKEHMVKFGLLGKHDHSTEVDAILANQADASRPTAATHHSLSDCKDDPPELAQRNYVLFEGGDVFLSLYSESEKQVHSYQVSSHILKMTSSVLREKGERLGWDKPIKLNESNPEMLLLALRMLHFQYPLLPTGFATFQEVLDFTVIVDKYQLVNSLYPLVKDWVLKWKTENHFYWIFVADVFGFDDDVHDAIAKLSNQISDYSFDAVIDLEQYDKKDTLVFLHPRLSAKLTDKIRHTRNEKIAALKKCFDDIRQERTRKNHQVCQKNDEDSSFCDIVQFGHFMKTIIELELDSDGRVWKQSLDYIVGRFGEIEPMRAYKQHGAACCWTAALDEVVKRELDTVISILQIKTVTADKPALTLQEMFRRN